MGISKQPPKPFPITKGLPCQLKWTHSTIYLTDGVSASCHRVAGDPLEIKNGELNFHNLPEKLESELTTLYIFPKLHEFLSQIGFERETNLLHIR